MASDPDEVLVGEHGGTIYLAPFGTTEPDSDDDALDGAFVAVGYVTPAGVGFNDGKTQTGIEAWNADEAVRFLTPSSDTRVTFAVMQWNPDTILAAYKGGTFEDLGGGHYKFTPPDNEDEQPEYVIVIDIPDGDKDYRFVYRRCESADPLAYTFVKTDATALPLNFKLKDVGDDSPAHHFFTNDPAFADAPFES